MNAVIQFNDVTKKYRLGMTRLSLPELTSDWVRSLLRRSTKNGASSNDFWAVRNISFQMNKGNSLALVGANGAGKTTILKLIAQITKPTSGFIKVNGRLSALIELGAGFHPDLSGRENIFLNGTILGLKKTEIQRRFDRIVDFSELARFIDTPVKRYSSGMVVRLGFAIAASIDPDILLVDEVLAVGDTLFSLKCMARIKELIANGTSLIFVSHNMGLVKAVCNQAMYIDKGSAKFIGATNDAIDAYNNDLNNQRMNELNGTQQEKVKLANFARISKVEFVPLNRDQQSLHSSYPAKILINYQSDQDIDEVSVVLRIIRSDGVSCCTLYSQIDHAPLCLHKGDGVISAVLSPLQLSPGSYYVVATLKNKDETITYDMVYSDWLQVTSDIKGQDDLDAVFEPIREWDTDFTAAKQP